MENNRNNSENKAAVVEIADESGTEQEQHNTQDLGDRQEQADCVSEANGSGWPTETQTGSAETAGRPSETAGGISGTAVRPDEQEKEPGIPDVLAAIADLKEGLDEKDGAARVREEMLDRMHRELMTYQDDVVKKIQSPVLNEVIEILLRMRKIQKHIPEECSEENYSKLIRRYSDVADDLGDLLDNFNVAEYASQSDIVDASRQQILKTVPTKDPALHNRVAEKISSGFIQDSRIIKYEKVAVYKYTEEKENGTE